MHLLLCQTFPLLGKKHFFWILFFVLTTLLYLRYFSNQQKDDPDVKVTCDRMCPAEECPVELICLLQFIENRDNFLLWSISGLPTSSQSLKLLGPSGWCMKPNTFITSDDLDVWPFWYIGDRICLCDSAYSKYVNYLHLSLLTLEGLMPCLGNYLGVRWECSFCFCTVEQQLNQINYLSSAYISMSKSWKRSKCLEWFYLVRTCLKENIFFTVLKHAENNNGCIKLGLHTSLLMPFNLTTIIITIVQQQQQQQNL